MQRDAEGTSGGTLGGIRRLYGAAKPPHRRRDANTGSAPAASFCTSCRYFVFMMAGALSYRVPPAGRASGSLQKAVLLFK
jgi:hypothetical protein